jgi:CheY-like chemotaxis protein
MLEQYGAKVVTAASAVEALHLLPQVDPHAIVADLRMPGMDGFDFLRRLQTDPRRARIPVVAVTALGTDADYLKTLTHGFQAHLTKPVEDTVLASVVLRVIRDRRPRRA